MATDKRIVNEVVNRLENCLKELKIKYETKTSKDEALIFGKFVLGKEKYRLVIHLQNDEFIPKTYNFAEVKTDDRKKEDCVVTPNLNFQAANKSGTLPYSGKEGLEIKRGILEEAAKLIPKLKR